MLKALEWARLSALTFPVVTGPSSTGQ